MKQSAFVPYLVFATAYTVSGLLLAALYDGLSTSAASAAFAGWITTFASAFASLLLARRFGRLGHGGLAITTVAVFVVSMTAVIAILHAIANTGGSEVSVARVISDLEWGVVARSFVQTVGLPPLALLLTQRFRILAG